MNSLCDMHENDLEFELELRGFLRPTLIAEADLAPLHYARRLIFDHAANFAGSAAVKLFEGKKCPLCFTNEAIRRDGKNPGLTVNDWVEHAADEAEVAMKSGSVHQNVLV